MAAADTEIQINVWEERDRLMVRVTDANDKELACWWDDDARQLFEDGFLDRRDLRGSVESYLRHLGVIE